MDEDRLYGTAKNIGGKVQEGFGRAAGDTETQVRGVVNQAAGTAQDLYGQAKDAAADAADSMFHGAATVQDTCGSLSRTAPIPLQYWRFRWAGSSVAQDSAIKTFRD